MTENVIEVRDISKGYRRGIMRKRKPVLDAVTFSVRRGTVFGFLGHNGAGKSTTIKVLLDLVKADSGEARILGEKPSSASARRRIGYLPETADYYPFLTPRKLLLLYGDLFNFSRKESARRADELLELVGMEREKNEKISTFSKGMKQRVGIAQALLNEPELLILDEPASGLDPLGQREIRDLIIDQKKRGRTIFFSSHELAEVEAVCDEAAIIRRGKMVRSGALSDLVPYRAELVARVRARDADCLKEKPFVGHVRPQANPEEIHFVAPAGYTIDRLASELKTAGCEPISIGSVRDSLEDIFLELMKSDK